jgi:flavin-dependent dehydrogenase
MNGEGIHYAMLSGDVAADVILDSFKLHDYSKKALDIYRKICMRNFGNYLKKCVGLQKSQLKTMRLVIRYASTSLKVLQGTHNIFMEKYNPKKISLTIAFNLLLEILKSKLNPRKK